MLLYNDDRYAIHIGGILNALGSQTLSIIVYGSTARGTDTSESDVDIAVIVRSNLDNKEEDALSDFVVDMNIKYDKVFSVIDIENDVIEKWQNVVPFYKNMRKEGIVLWKAA